jgi:FkbM family methyltransferase
MECLKLNTKGHDNITYQNEGLGAEDCLSVLKQSVKNCGNSYVIPTKNLEFIEEPKNGECVKIIWKREGAPDKIVEATTIQIRSIDSYNFDNIDLIKIDTQGHELPIIKGAIKTIKRCKPWLCFELGDKKHGVLGYTDKEMIKFVSKQGYKIEIRTNTDCIMRPI